MGTNTGKPVSADTAAQRTFLKLAASLDPKIFSFLKRSPVGENLIRDLSDDGLDAVMKAFKGLAPSTRAPKTPSVEGVKGTLDDIVKGIDSKATTEGATSGALIGGAAGGILDDGDSEEETLLGTTKHRDGGITGRLRGAVSGAMLGAGLGAGARGAANFKRVSKGVGGAGHISDLEKLPVSQIDEFLGTARDQVLSGADRATSSLYRENALANDSIKKRLMKEIDDLGQMPQLGTGIGGSINKFIENSKARAEGWSGIRSPIDAFAAALAKNNRGSVSSRSDNIDLITKFKNQVLKGNAGKDFRQSDAEAILRDLITAKTLQSNAASPLAHALKTYGLPGVLGAATGGFLMPVIGAPMGGVLGAAAGHFMQPSAITSMPRAVTSLQSVGKSVPILPKMLPSMSIDDLINNSRGNYNFNVGQIDPEEAQQVLRLLGLKGNHFSTF